jgi:hypothetical protein
MPVYSFSNLAESTYAICGLLVNEKNKNRAIPTEFNTVIPRKNFRIMGE